MRCPAWPVDAYGVINIVGRSLYGAVLTHSLERLERRFRPFTRKIIKTSAEKRTQPTGHTDQVLARHG